MGSRRLSNRAWLDAAIAIMFFFIRKEQRVRLSQIRHAPRIFRTVA
jgi:hypothetical protein